MEKELIKELNELQANLKADGYKNWSYSCMAIDRAIEYISKQAGFISKYSQPEPLLPPSSPTATAEEILKKHFDEDWPEDMGVRGTAEEWEAFKENQPVFIKSMIEAMTEYASLKEQEAHNRAVQECIDFIKDWYENERALEGKDFYEELEKLKK